MHFLFSLLPAFFTFLFQTSSVSSMPLPSGSSDKVSVKIYYQSTGNADFMSRFVPKIFEPKVISTVNLHLSPWGNSHLVSNNTFKCQGGVKECYLNTIEACAINAWPEVVKHLDFIVCVEDKVYKSSVWEACYDLLQLDRALIDECYKSGLGTELEKKYADETAALKPPHAFTPWVVVAGKPIYDDFGNILKYICRAYKGSSLPEYCKHLPIKPKQIQKVSFRRNVAEVEATKFT